MTKLDFSQFDAELLNPLADAMEPPPDFAACLNAHGMYETMRFVLRLSPKNHRLVNSISNGVYAASEIPPEAIQAYSTYLHETVHWWQHVGSTAGLIYSLSYPGQAHTTMEYLQKVLSSIGPKKSVLKWAQEAALAGTPPTDPTIIAANIAVNNAIDVEFYKRFAVAPADAQEIFEHQYFECVGHGYQMAYGHVLGMLSAAVDPEFSFLPDMHRWDPAFLRLRQQEHLGHYWGSPIMAGPVGLHALFEGQARFAQLQYLNGAAEESLRVKDLKAAGYLSGIYVEAFEAFLQHSKSDWPETIEDPIVGLFLLICDLAINPKRGFPHDIDTFEDFIVDVDAGIRFGRLCLAVTENPDVRTSVKNYSREEYAEVAEILTRQCGYDHPLLALGVIASWATTAPGMIALMKEQATFRFEQDNLPVRVMLAQFVAFSRDKLIRPEFFCWPGAWMTGSKANPDIQTVFLRHLSLFQDSENDSGVFPRQFPDKDPEGTKEMFNIFYGTNLLYNLTRQWILHDGPFRYDFEWLSEKYQNGELADWAKSQFARYYGAHPDAFELL